MSDKKVDYEVPAGTPCIDKACSAISSKNCRYPLWMMCGHPIERPTREGS